MSRSLAAAILCAGCAHPPIHPDAVVHHDQALEHLAAGRCEQAEERCRLALEYGRGFAHPHNCLGLVALDCRGDIESAEQHFKAAIARASDFAEAHNNLGVVFFRRTPPSYALACPQFEAALGIDPRFADARENLGTCLMRQGAVAGATGDATRQAALFSRARSHLIRLLELEPESVDAHHHLGFIALEQSDWSEAAARFGRCLELEPDNPLCAYNRGVLHNRTGDCARAIEDFERALEAPGRAEVELSARHNLGLARLACGEAASERHWHDILERDPSWCDAHYALARVRQDEAARHCSAFLRCSPEGGSANTDAQRAWCGERS